MSIKLKDIEMFWKSVWHSGFFKGSSEECCWWDLTTKQNLDKIVEHLSDPNTAERRKIRGILIKNNIRCVLDAACGVGTELVGYKANNMGIEYAGMDISNSMLEIAKKNHPTHRFIYGDVNNMPFYDNSFEAVILKHILEHLPYYNQAVTEAVRVASKIVIIDFFHKLWFFDYCRKHKEGFWENWYSKRKFERFIGNLPISSYETFPATGTSRQSAEIYVLHKLQKDNNLVEK